MPTQVDRQYNTPLYDGRRALNIDLFDFVNVPDDRRHQLDAWLPRATIDDIQAAYATRQLSSVELVAYYIDRIRRYDVDHYHSVLELNPEVFDIARQCDHERTQAPSQSMLHGIPILLKDNIGTGDRLHNTAGSKALEQSHCDRDSFIAARLRSAGAIILGKTNLSEWANFMSFDSSNGFSVLGGQTRNAYGRFDVGGSSSGSGCAVAQSFATVAIGTETSGSLVSPASANGICTLKPSIGLISRDRIIPITDKQDTAGPMARNMTDLAHLLNGIRGVDAQDAQTQQGAPLAETDFAAYLQADALDGVRLGVVRWEDPVRDDDPAMIDQAIATLEDAGAEVVICDPFLPEFNIITLYYGLHHGVNAYLEAIGSDLTLADIVRFNAADLPNRAPFGQDLLELSANTPLNPATAQAYEQLHQQNHERSAAATRTALQAHDLAALVDLNNYGTLAYAPCGFPAVCVPSGYRDSGEPVGLTFWGDYLQDAQLISYAYAYEQARNVWRPPPIP